MIIKKSLKFDKYIPSIGSTVANFVTLVLMILFQIMDIILFFSIKTNDNNFYIIICLAVNGVYSSIYFIIYIPLYSIYKTNLKKHQFTLDSQMQDILNSYNKRMKDKNYMI